MDKISVIIPARDRVQDLDECLRSIELQNLAALHEIIIVDDGSAEPISEIPGYKEKYKIIRQIPLGVAAARNRGIQEARGDLLLFIDSDCALCENCLSNFLKTVMNNPDAAAFQLKLVGHINSCAGTMEHLRLSAIQNMKQMSGRIAYLNTSGFAVRRSFIQEADFFPVNVTRGEDTCVLTKLMYANDPPVFVSDAIVKHSPRYSLAHYMCKHIHIGFQSCSARLLLAKNTDTIMSPGQKMKMFSEMKAAAAKAHVPYYYLFFISIAYLLECCGRLAFHLFGIKSDKFSVLSSNVEPVREDELISKVFLQVERKKSFIITYLTAWSLVQSKTSRIFKKLLNKCDLIYADGMGVVLASLVTELRWLKKVTLNNFYEMLFEEVSNRNYSVAFIGAKPGVACAVSVHFQEKYQLRVLFSECGYLNKEEKSRVISELVQLQPDIIFLGMGQPLQEEFAFSIREYLPHAVFWCVGDLFNTIIGVSPKPPKFIRKVGLEWLHRLIHDPARLWKRYVFGLPQLAYYILTEIFQKVSRRIARVLRVDLDF